MSDPFDDNVCSKSEVRAIVQAATEAGLRTTIKVLTAELAAAKAEVERLKVELNHEKEAKKFRSNLDHETFMTLRADLDRHKRALELARTTLEYVGNWGNDPTSVAIARNCEKGLEEITRILDGGE